MHANILGHDVTYKLGMPGRHMAMNSLAVLAAASLAGADLALAALSLSQIEPAVGRGARRALEVGNGEATLIDESYNANPASMAAALNVLGSAAVGPQGRRIAVLGDMLELGPTGPALHLGLNEAIKANQHRSGVLLWSADAQLVGRAFHRVNGAAMPRIRLVSKRRWYRRFAPATRS